MEDNDLHEGRSLRMQNPSNQGYNHCNNYYRFVTYVPIYIYIYTQVNLILYFRIIADM